MAFLLMKMCFKPYLATFWEARCCRECECYELWWHIHRCEGQWRRNILALEYSLTYSLTFWERLELIGIFFTFVWTNCHDGIVCLLAFLASMAGIINTLMKIIS